MHPFPLMNPQQYLDDLLASRPDLQQYVTKLWYLPMEAPIPSDVTHVLRLSSIVSPERGLAIGLVLVPQYAFLVEMILAAVATLPPAGR